MKLKFFLFFLFLCSFFNFSCVSYSWKIQKPIRLLKSGQPLKAAKAVEKMALAEGKDQLVYLLDYATFLQIAGRYQKSTQAFLKAESLSEVKDYHSLSRVTGSLLLNEGLVQYKGDDYEKLLINVMLAINFLMEGKKEAALVETRKINEKLYRYKHEAKRNYEQNVFAYYLAALIWESDQKWEDAYLDYKKAYELNPNISYLKEDLIRLSSLSQNWEEHKKWTKKFNLSFDSKWKDPSFGELIFIFQQGKGPKKYPHPDFRQVPKLFPSFSFLKSCLLEFYPSEEGSKNPLPELQASINAIQNHKTESQETSALSGEKKLSLPPSSPLLFSKKTQMIYSVQDVAIKTLNDQYKTLIAKRLAGIVLKEAVSYQIKKENEALGSMIQLVLHLSDRADLRQWSTLPETLQLARVRLKQGTYKMKLYGLDKFENSYFFYSKKIKILPQKKTFIQVRSLR